MKNFLPAILVLAFLGYCVYVTTNKDWTLEQIAKEDSTQVCEDGLGCPKN